MAPSISERVDRGLNIARFERSTPTLDVQHPTFNRKTWLTPALSVERFGLALQNHRLAFGHYQDVVMDAGLSCACKQAGERLI